MGERAPAALVLEDGSVFRGEAIGALGRSAGEVVFNTSMTGYQEILTDPSYARQIVTLTYPHIGNTGINSEDEEAERIFSAGLIVRDVPKRSSNWRSELDLPSYLERNSVVAVAGIDTRRLTRKLRSEGAQRGVVIAGDEVSAGNVASVGKDLARAFPGLEGMDLAKEVTTSQRFRWEEGVWELGQGHQKPASPGERHVVAYDFGIKRNILRLLIEHGCNVTVVPAETTADDVLAMDPDGIFLSNGPGDPEPCDYAIEAIKRFLDVGVPLFGICLGHQLLALASGARTIKMKFGHHGANHPVQDLRSERVIITSQNHGFAVDEGSLPEHLVPTHRSLFDGSLQGVMHRERPAFGFQGHPEASPGPQDARALFEHFARLMDERAVDA